MGESEYSAADCLLALREESRDGQKIQDDDNDAKLKVLVEYIKAPDRRLVLSTKNTGSCLTVRGSTVTDTVLGATEFLDFSVHVMM